MNAITLLPMKTMSSLMFAGALIAGLPNVSLAEAPDFLLKDARYRPLVQCYAQSLELFAKKWGDAADDADDSVQALHRIIIGTGGYMAAAELIIPICNDDFRSKASAIGDPKDLITIAEYVFRTEVRKRQAEVYANCLAKESDPEWSETYAFCRERYDADTAAQR